MREKNWKAEYEALRAAVAEYASHDMSIIDSPDRLKSRERMLKAAGLPYAKWILGEAPLPGFRAKAV